MRLTSTRLLALGAILAIAAAACSDDDGGDTPAPADEPQDTAQETLVVGTSDLGEILVDAEGRTLYAFTPDEQGASTCYDDCAATWPALTVDGDPVGGDGVDAALLGTVERDDGTVQVTYGDWPLYLFSGDEAPGDTNGQEIGDVWYVVSSEGAPVESEGEAEGSGETDEGGQGTLAVEESDLGQILVDSRGRTLYAFMPDEQGASTCYDDCAANWPALTIDGDPVGGDGVDAALLGTIERDDGSVQVTYDGWPLYLFAGDETRNDVNGQGVGDVWYVVSPDGAPIQ